MNEKQAFDDWKEFIGRLIDATPVEVNETDEVKQARITALEGDPEQWFVYYFPQYAYALPALFHKEATHRVLYNPEWYEVRIWSRELAKSTRTMMETLYLVLVGNKATAGGTQKRVKKKYTLLISNSLDNAVRLLTPYKLNLEHNRRLIHDYGPQECSGKWQAAEFTTEQGAAFRALGAGQSPRGTRNEEARPDIILFDDVDTDADCFNPEIINKKWKWIEEAAIGTRSVSRPVTIIFCGNRIAVDCCIMRAASFADKVQIMNIRNENGKSTWPEKNSEADIDRVLNQKSFAASQKEYFNNPVTEGAVFKELAYKPALDIDKYERLICYTDPSYKETGDYKATVLVGKAKDEYHVIKCYLEQTTTAKMIEWHQQIYSFTGKKRCEFFMEDVFMQDVIINQVNEVSGKGFCVYGDKRKKSPKFVRIETLLEPMVRNGGLYLNENERHSPHMIRLAEQFIALAPGSTAHDDGPDAVEGAVWLLCKNTGNSKEVCISGFGKHKRYEKRSR